MQSIIELFQEVGNATAIPMDTMIIRVLVALVFGVVIGLVSYATHTSEQWDTAVIHSQMIITIIAAIVIMAIGYNVASAFGLFGILSLIRFRTTLKNTKDTTIFLFAVAIGRSCGSGLFSIAVVGTVVVSVVLFILRIFPLLRFQHSTLSLQTIFITDTLEQIHPLFENKKIRYKLMSLSDKSQTLNIHLFTSVDYAFAFAKEFKENYPEFVKSFKVERD